MVTTPGLAARRRKTFLLKFDVPLAPGRSLLTDRTHESDLVTAKVVAYRLLQDGYEGLSTYKVLLALGWFFRWRLARSIFANRDLSPAFFEEFVDLVRRGGMTALVDLTERVEIFKALVTAGESAVPLSESPDGPRVNASLLAEELGIPAFKSLPAALRKDLFHFLEAKGFRLWPSTSAWARQPVKEAPALGAGGMRPSLQAWQLLWDLRDHLQHDPLRFDPFESVSLQEYLQSARARPQRTGTIPAKQACYLLDRALRWVTNYSPELLRLLGGVPPLLATPGSRERRPKYQELFRTARFAGPAAPRLFIDSYWHNRASRPDGSVCLHEAAFTLLAAACAIVIAAFSARRNEEVTQLNDDCVRRDDRNRAWLEFWVERTLMDYDKVPVPASVAMAVQVLRALRGQHSNGPARTSKLFHFVAPGGREFGFDFGLSLSAFASYCRVPLLPNGDSWHFKPHQLRRFFAIAYAHRFKYGSLTALTMFLKHLDDRATWIYVSDVSKGALSWVGEQTELNSGSGEPWYRAIARAEDAARARTFSQCTHIPSDWEQAVRSLRSRVDILPKLAAIPLDSLNTELSALYASLVPASVRSHRASRPQS